MLAKCLVRVTTRDREFVGHISEIGISPFSSETRACVVDDEGQVHYFTVERSHVVVL